MADAKYEAAWRTFQQMADHEPPYVVMQQLRDLFVPEDIIAVCVTRHEREVTRVLDLEEPPAVGRENAPRWYTGPQPGDRNWPAFRKQLETTLSESAVAKIDDASDKVVAMLDHPATASFRSRGLVVGHVQSGKTSNFTAVISKAADRGYRMFIVFSGIHNSLRRQTQTRLIRDVVQLNDTLWHQITKPEHDFVPPANAASLLASKDQKLLLVVKKNAPVLRKLRKWLREAEEHLGNCPTLIIDDEADQATVATTTINPLITDIIKCLPKVVYVGYTATPFANLLIDPSQDADFYPKDFILSLPRGEDYQGPEELFGRAPMDGEDPNDVPGGLDMIRSIPDDELTDLRPEKRSDAVDFAPQITASLRNACLWFWLATAARRARGQLQAHSSMLVHAHSDVAVHESYRGPLNILRAEILSELRSGTGTLTDELQRLWDMETSRVPPLGDDLVVSFAEVLEQLSETVQQTKIIMDHYRSRDRLDYTGAASTVIAVGGNTLSRGLTLEGLVVSFFVRSADVYDTLLQMGRWFGYRPGYSDLPRIYMPDAMRQWFAHLATVEAEMRGEIDRYLKEHKTPLELAVRIRCHPKMRVTSAAKQSSAVRASASYGGQLVESRYYPAMPLEEALEWHGRNAGAVEHLLDGAVREGTRETSVEAGRVLWRNVPTELVQRFVDEYRFHERSTDVSPELMGQYIDRRVAGGGLHTWNVGVLGNSLDPRRKRVELASGDLVSAVIRTRTIDSTYDDVADIKTLTGSRDPALDLEVPAGDPITRSSLNKTRRQQQPETGLLLLYPIDARSSVRDSQTRLDSDGKPRPPSRADLNLPGDIVWGAALVFPEPTNGEDLEVEYDYVAADLSRIFPAAVNEFDDEDASVLEMDMDTEPAGA